MGSGDRVVGGLSIVARIWAEIIMTKGKTTREMNWCYENRKLKYVSWGVTYKLNLNLYNIGCAVGRVMCPVRGAWTLV